MTATITSGAEVEAGYRWLEATLQADTTLIGMLRPGGDDGTATNADRVPDDVPLPAVMFAYQGGTTSRVIDREVYLSGIWQVKVLTEEDGLDLAGPIARRLHQALEGRNAETIPAGFGPDFGTLHQCTRETVLSVQETDETGRVFRHLGGMYRLLVGSN
jgi:hypothetical protein